MNKKVFYECGCVGYVSVHNVFIRLEGCKEHEDMQYCLRPNSRVMSVEEVS